MGIKVWLLSWAEEKDLRNYGRVSSDWKEDSQ